MMDRIIELVLFIVIMIILIVFFTRFFQLQDREHNLK